MDDKILAPFVPSPMEVVKKMLDYADVKRGDKVVDLGCGDSRILIAAAMRGARGFGVELNKELVRQSEFNIDRYNLDHRIEVALGSALEYDIGEADLVTLYLTLGGNEIVRPILEDQLKGSAKVVSHDFRIRGWKTSKVPDYHEIFPHSIYLYEMNEI